MNPSILTSEDGFVFESDRNHILGMSNLLLMGFIFDPKTGTWVEKDGHNSSSEENDQDDEDQDDGDVSGSEGTLMDIEYIDIRVEGDESGDGESEEDEVNSVGRGVAIDDHVVGDPTEEDVKDRSGGEDTMCTPLETAPMEHEQPLMKHEHESISTPLEAAPLEHGTGGENIMGKATLLEQPSTGVFMEFRFNQVDNMLCEQSHIAKSVDQLDKKVKKLIDMLTKSVGDASYGLNLLHGDM
ncbi:hypothetical protein Scep_004362 [Stephania cephalantha]|uniref:Uncharacterized protein n=1 Tax=Stephania cephalantha TaxID=152367 RepID=A0AAP0KTS7_9MAGN